MTICIISFSSIPYYSNVKLISKDGIGIRPPVYSLEVHASINKRPFYRGYPIFQTKVLDPYPHLNRGQHIRRAKGLSVPTITYTLSLIISLYSPFNFRNCMQSDITSQQLSLTLGPIKTQLYTTI